MLTYSFIISLVLTVTVIILRGIGILTFIPGGIIWVLILITISLGMVQLLKLLQD
jgi:hypothetical protein